MSKTTATPQTPPTHAQDKGRTQGMTPQQTAGWNQHLKAWREEGERAGLKGDALDGFTRDKISNIVAPMVLKHRRESAETAAKEKGMQGKAVETYVRNLMDSQTEADKTKKVDVRLVFDDKGNIVDAEEPK